MRLRARPGGRRLRRLRAKSGKSRSDLRNLDLFPILPSLPALLIGSFTKSRGLNKKVDRVRCDIHRVIGETRSWRMRGLRISVLEPSDEIDPDQNLPVVVEAAEAGGPVVSHREVVRVEEIEAISEAGIGGKRAGASRRRLFGKLDLGEGAPRALQGSGCPVRAGEIADSQEVGFRFLKAPLFEAPEDLRGDQSGDPTFVRMVVELRMRNFVSQNKLELQGNSIASMSLSVTKTKPVGSACALAISE